ncbi:membrane-bound alkaline phosphatase [Stomoxys calcitrans]|uniref:membrane-bound alkaline phosphatase n=1 Tax=Stomoxys calcitrans TaxID=35570 RepID=UPI0027E3795A|nr:membrane-bound alkaline phosphatase [Stomoxys calcitrans]
MDDMLSHYLASRGTHDMNRHTPEEEKDPEFWRSMARTELFQSLEKQKLNTNMAMNIIMFLGDGMSLSTVTAARILKGQQRNRNGEEDALSLEKFPHMALSRTYCANAQVPDSACTATAYLCGVKSNIITIGVTANVEFNNCSASMDPRNQVSSIASWAQSMGMSTGFITTTTLTHASPAGTYAHVASRFYESDSDIASFGLEPETCMDMAQQLVTQEPGRNFNVMMGGGMTKFLPYYQRDLHGNYGERRDGKDLLTTWQSMHPEGVFVVNRDELLQVNTSEASHIMGIFQSKAMEIHALADKKKQPSLAEMTEIALKLLRRNEEGYFIFIEGGHIDTAHHQNKAALALDETLEFDKAIQLARSMTDPQDTLIVVTADHGHPLTIAGYPDRGTAILGLNQHDLPMDGLKFSTLNYVLGPQQYLDETGKRLDLEKFPRKIDSVYPSYINEKIGYHSGEDVGIFASGPFAHLFTGVLQQNSIPHLMAYAACLGNGPTICDKADDEDECRENLSNSYYGRRK